MHGRSNLRFSVEALTAGWRVAMAGLSVAAVCVRVHAHAGRATGGAEAQEAPEHQQPWSTSLNEKLCMMLLKVPAVWIVKRRCISWKREEPGYERTDSPTSCAGCALCRRCIHVRDECYTVACIAQSTTS